MSAERVVARAGGLALLAIVALFFTIPHSLAWTVFVSAAHLIFQLVNLWDANRRATEGEWRDEN